MNAPFIKLLSLLFQICIAVFDGGLILPPEFLPSLKSNPRIPDRFTSVPLGKAEVDLVGAGVAPKAGTGNAAVGGEALPKAPKPLGPSASATPPSGGSGGGSPPSGSPPSGTPPSASPPVTKGSVSGRDTTPGGGAAGTTPPSGAGATPAVAAVPSPYEIAKNGGRHSGFLKQRLSKTPEQLRNDAATFRQRAKEHKEKIDQRDGYNKISDDPDIQRRADEGRTKHLNKEISNFTEQAEILEELAKIKEGQK